MTDRDYELLSQYLDGELPAPQAQALRQRLLAEPVLRAAYEELKSADTRVRKALDTEQAEQVPGHIAALLAAAPVTDGTRRWRWGLTAAATVLLASGLLLHESGPQRQDMLAQVLEQQPSSSAQWTELPGGDSVRPVLSFRSVDGNWCREYLSRGGDRTERAVACRVDGAWQSLISAPVTLQEETAGYRAAGASDADEVADYIARNAADIPLSASQERELIDNAWD